MGYKETINKLEVFDYSRYKDISSYEKLMLYSTMELERKGVPLDFNYICIASFIQFPMAFCCDNEFTEFPSVDRLNRTVMHLKYVKKGQPFITGSPKEGYKLTIYGKSIALEVESILKNTKIDTTVKAPVIDKHKSGSLQNYTKLVQSEGYKKYLNNRLIEINWVWKFFDVIPYTQMNKIKKNFEECRKYAKEVKDEECVNFIKLILERM